MTDEQYVSIIIPTFNEEGTILNCITSLLNGSYPHQNLEFIIADGNSSDDTIRVLKNFQADHPDIQIKITDNPHKTQGYGLNIALENIDQKCDIVLRADAHSIYPENYIKQCVNTLQKSNADNAGGVMVPLGKNNMQKAIAFCMSNVLGVGNARFHLGNYSGFVDTVYLGCFKRGIFDKIGKFDPVMTPNEDAELNLRILKAEGRIYLNSDIQVGYYPRANIHKLISQYYRYGQGRCKTFKKHKVFSSVRQLVPPIWVIFTLIIIVMSLIWKFFIVPLMAYLLVLITVSVYYAARKRDVAILLSPICFMVMHYAWGIGFLHQLLKGVKS